MQMCEGTMNVSGSTGARVTPPEFSAHVTFAHTFNYFFDTNISTPGWCFLFCLSFFCFVNFVQPCFKIENLCLNQFTNRRARELRKIKAGCRIRSSRFSETYNSSETPLVFSIRFLLKKNLKFNFRFSARCFQRFINCFLFSLTLKFQSNLILCEFNSPRRILNKLDRSCPPRSAWRIQLAS